MNTESIAHSIRVEVATEVEVIEREAAKFRSIADDTTESDRRREAARAFVAEAEEAVACLKGKAARAADIAEALAMNQPTAIDLADFGDGLPTPGELSLAALFGVGPCCVPAEVETALIAAGEATAILADPAEVAALAGHPRLVELLRRLQIGAFGLAVQLRRARRRAAEVGPTLRLAGDGFEESGHTTTLATGRRISARLEAGALVVVAGNERLAIAFDHEAGDHHALSGLLVATAGELSRHVAGPDADRLFDALEEIGHTDAPVSIGARFAGGFAVPIAAPMAEWD